MRQKSDMAVKSLTRESLQSQKGGSKTDRKLKFSEGAIRTKDEDQMQQAALEKLDKMVQSVNSSDIPGMCLPISQLTNSRSDGYIQNICRYVVIYFKVFFSIKGFFNLSPNLSFIDRLCIHISAAFRQVKATLLPIFNLIYAVTATASHCIIITITQEIIIINILMVNTDIAQ